MRVQIGIGSLLSVGLLSLNSYAATAIVNPSSTVPVEGTVPVEPSVVPLEEPVAPELTEVTPVENVEVIEVSDNAVSDNGSFEFGLRAGFGLPLGKAMKDAEMNKSLMGQIPVWLDLGYRINRNIYVGIFAQAGFGLQAKEVKDTDCKEGTTCNDWLLAGGINAHYHIMPTSSFDPWVGLGVGYEMWMKSVKNGNVEASSTFHGFQFGNIQVGGDFRLSPNVGIGPFLAFSVGQFSSTSAKMGDKEAETKDIKDKEMHMWGTAGIRGTFNL